MKNLSLTNFKVFKEYEEFTFAPITLLTGKNNSGKSTILKALLILDDYVKSNNQLVIKLTGPNHKKHKINTLSNLYSWDNSSKSFKISYLTESAHNLSFEFSGNAEDNFALLKHFTWSFNNNKLGVEIFNDHSFNLSIDRGFFSMLSFGNADNNEGDIKKYEQAVEVITKTLKDVEAVISSSKPTSVDYINAIQTRQAEERRLKMNRKRLKELTGKELFPKKAINKLVEINDQSQVNISYITQIIRFGLRELEAEDGSVVDRQEKNYIYMVQELLGQAMNLNMHHLSANRNIQERIFVAGDQNQEIFNLIDAYQRTENTKGSQGRTFAERWLKKFELGNDVRTKLYEGGIAKAVQIMRNGSWRNLADLGFGAGQLVTIILKVASVLDIQNENRRSLYSRRVTDNLLLIEEPEANLHPNFQSALAEMFADAINISQSVGNKLTMILETHSEYMLRFFQLIAVSEDTQIKILPELIQIFYLDGGKPSNIKVKLDGSLSLPFGNGFTDVADKTALELFKLQRQINKS